MELWAADSVSRGCNILAAPISVLRNLLLVAVALLGGCFFKFDMVTHEAPVAAQPAARMESALPTEPSEAEPVLRYAGSPERLEQIARSMRVSPSGRDWEIIHSGGGYRVYKPHETSTIYALKRNQVIRFVGYTHDKNVSRLIGGHLERGDRFDNWIVLERVEPNDAGQIHQHWLRFAETGWDKEQLRRSR